MDLVVRPINVTYAAGRRREYYPICECCNSNAAVYHISSDDVRRIFCLPCLDRVLGEVPSPDWWQRRNAKLMQKLNIQRRKAG